MPIKIKRPLLEILIIYEQSYYILAWGPNIKKGDFQNLICNLFLLWSPKTVSYALKTAKGLTMRFYVFTSGKPIFGNILQIREGNFLL